MDWMTRVSLHFSIVGISPMANKAIEQSRNHLGELAVMQRRINESEKIILKRAEERLDEVNAQIGRAGKDVLNQSQTYISLIEERDTLHRVITQARASI